MFSNCRREKRRGQKNQNFRMSVPREGKGKEGGGERNARDRTGSKAKITRKTMESRLPFHDML